jgi:preprotein translocase subunit SecG
MIISLLVLHGFVTVAMIGLILLQKSDSAGPLGMGGGSTNSLFTARGVANVLTRSTAFLAVLFIGNCLLIGKLITRDTSDVASLIKTKSTATQSPKVPAKEDKTTQTNAPKTSQDEPSAPAPLPENIVPSAENEQARNDHHDEPEAQFAAPPESVENGDSGVEAATQLSPLTDELPPESAD